MNKIIMGFLTSIIVFFITDVSLYAMDDLEDYQMSSLTKQPPHNYSGQDVVSENATQQWVVRIQAPLLDNNIDDGPCITCFRTHCPKENLEKVIATGGNILGAVSPIAHWNLSRDFWRRFIDNEGIAVILASMSAVPILTIGAHTTKEEALKIKRNIQHMINEKEIRKRITCWDVVNKIPIETGKLLGGVAWSVGYAYLDYVYFYPLIGGYCTFIIVPTFITSVNAGYWGLDHNINAFNDFVGERLKSTCRKNLMKENHSALQLTKIKEKLKSIYWIIQNKSESEVETLINQATDPYKAIFQCRRNEEGDPESNFCTTAYAKKKIFQGMGWYIGMTGAWPTQPLTVEPMRLLLRATGAFEEHNVETIAQTTGWAAWITMVGVLSYPTSKVFGNIYDILEAPSSSCKRCSLKSIALGLAYGAISVVGVVSRTELALRYTLGAISKPVVTASAAIGRFALNYFTIDKFFNCSPPPSQKQKAIAFIDKLLENLPKLNKKSRDELAQLLEINIED